MFAVIFLPRFYLQAALRWHPELDGSPVAVVDGNSTKSTVLECNDAAQAGGVASGMPTPQALARCSALILLPRTLTAEKTAQEILLEMAFSLSGEVESTAMGCCTSDLQRVTGNRWEATCTGIIRHLGELRLFAKIGAALNPHLAFIAARRAEPVLIVRSPEIFLNHLAIAEIDPPPDLLSILRDWGIHTLGQLTALPRGQLTDRLGPAADQLWQRAAGKSGRLLHLTRPAEEFAEAFDFEGEIDSLEPLHFILRRFLDQLHLRLDAAHRVVAQLELELVLENGATHARNFPIPSPTVDGEVLFRILGTHLDELRLDHRVAGVRLRVEPVLPGHQQFRLFDNPLRDPDKFNETLARIYAIVGPENAGIAQPADTHRPDSFHLAPPAFHTFAEGRSDASSTAIGLPLKRYRPSLSADVHMTRSGPAQVFSEAAHGDVISAAGPYRLSGDWWGDGTWQTEEWDVEIEGKGLFRISRQREGWRVEGCYESTIR